MIIIIAFCCRTLYNLLLYDCKFSYVNMETIFSLIFTYKKQQKTLRKSIWMWMRVWKSIWRCPLSWTVQSSSLTWWTIGIFLCIVRFGVFMRHFVDCSDQLHCPFIGITYFMIALVNWVQWRRVRRRWRVLSYRTFGHKSVLFLKFVSTLKSSSNCALWCDILWKWTSLTSCGFL